MAEWNSETIIVNETSMHYLRSGGEKPPLVMLHGFTDAARDCEVFARSFVDHYDVIMIDERGHGQSSPAPATYTMANQADDVAGVIQGLGLAKPIVFGHSIGAATAVQLAFQYPDLLSTVILEDPPYRDVQTRDDTSGWREWLRLYKQKPSEEQLVQALREQPLWHPDENASWVESKVQFDLSTFDIPLFTSGFDWRTLVSQIRIPGLLLIGDAARGAIVTQEVAQEMASLWPTLTVVHIENAGHSIRRDQPIFTFEAVQRYLHQRLKEVHG